MPFEDLRARRAAVVAADGLNRLFTAEISTANNNLQIVHLILFEFQSSDLVYCTCTQVEER